MTVGGGTPTLTLNDGGTATYTSRLRDEHADFQLRSCGRPEHGRSGGDGDQSWHRHRQGRRRQRRANLSGAVTSPAGTLQIDGVTTNISAGWQRLFPLDNINAIWPRSCKQGGAGRNNWRISAAGRRSPPSRSRASGYEVAVQYGTATAQYTVGSVDSSGDHPRPISSFPFEQ